MITYRQLKEFVNSIDDQFLNRPAIVFGEECSTAIVEVELEADHSVVFSDAEYDNAILPKKLFDDLQKDIPADESECEVKEILPPGFPLMYDHTAT